MSKFMEISKQKHETMSDFLGRYEIALSNLISTGTFIDIALSIYILSRTLAANVKGGIRVKRTINPKGNIDQLLSYIRVNYRDDEAVQDANDAAYLGYARN